MTLALIGVLQDVLIWFPLRFLLGAAINPLFILSETWMLVLAAPHQRGRAMGIYAAMSPPVTPSGRSRWRLSAPSGVTPFMIGLVAFVAVRPVPGAIRHRLPNLAAGDRRHRWGFASEAPTPSLRGPPRGGVRAGLSVALSALRLGLLAAEAEIATLLSVLIVGNVVIQVPLGLAAERWRPRLVLIVFAALTAVGCLLQPFLMGTPLIWLLVFCLGALSYGAYTVALVELGDRFSGPMLVAGNSAFALTSGIGSMAGPLGTGTLMDVFGIQGLPLTFGVLLIVFVDVGHGGSITCHPRDAIASDAGLGVGITFRSEKGDRP